MTSKPTAPARQYSDQEVDGGFSHPMLEKIRKLLISTEPEKWGIGGEDLSDELRYQRPRTSHEQVLVRDLPSGSLVLHVVQPVECHYSPGGYVPSAAGAAIYTVEVRDRIFDPAKLVDPKYSANFQGKRCDVIASGDIAKSLFLQVRSTIRELHRGLKKEFDAVTEELSKNLPDTVKAIAYDAWTKNSEQKDGTKTFTFSTEVTGVLVTLVKEVEGFSDSYRAIFSKGPLTYTHLPTGIARQCIRILEEAEQEAQLQKLNGVLKDLGFE